MKDLRLLIKIKNNLILKRAEQLWGEGINQSEIAKKCGISASTIGRYLNFKESPVTKKSLSGYSLGINGWNWKINAIKISDALMSSPDDIFPNHLREIRENSYKLELESKNIIELFKQKTPEEIAMENEERRIIREILKSLSAREEKVLIERFGLDDGNQRTLAEIGKDFDKSVERIRHIEGRALHKLRDLKRTKYLKEFYSIK